MYLGEAEKNKTITNKPSPGPRNENTFCLGWSVLFYNHAI